MPHELEGEHRPLAQSDAGGEAAPQAGGDSAKSGAEHGLRGGASVGGEDSRGTQPERATRYLETTHGVLSYAELAPLLADRVAAVEQRIAEGEYAALPLDEELLLGLHRSICGDLVPEWAGKWRDIEVRVGRLEPPPAFQLPMLMREYALDLQARWEAASVEITDLTLEFLAFAEGRFLTVHPFRDFNGRTIRLLLSELLRRLDLPEVDLAPAEDEAKAVYFSALEAADIRDWNALVDIWRARLDAEG